MTVTRCPLKIVTSQSVEYMTAYHEYARGFLPNAGGWIDQPYKVTEAIRFIEEKFNAHEAQKIAAGEEKAQKWQKQN